MTEVMAFFHLREREEEMRARLILLLLLCGFLAALQTAPEAAVLTAAGGDSLIWVDLTTMSLTLYQGGEQIGRWPVAAGTSDTPTPLGVFRITRKFVTEPSGFGTRFLGLSVPWGQYGIHGTNQPGSIGSRVSHGCIRMNSKDAETLYRLAPLGTKVVIEEGPFGELGWSLRALAPGDRGSLVCAAQRKLRALGYYYGAIDGIYGTGMSQAVRRFKQDNGVSGGDNVNDAMWKALGVALFE